jgi:hypothetical protein
MRLVDHLYFVAEHDDHHLARIWEFAQQTTDRLILSAIRHLPR